MNTRGVYTGRAARGDRGNCDLYGVFDLNFSVHGCTCDDFLLRGLRCFLELHWAYVIVYTIQIQGRQLRIDSKNAKCVYTGHVLGSHGNLPQDPRVSCFLQGWLL